MTAPLRYSTEQLTRINNLRSDIEHARRRYLRERENLERVQVRVNEALKILLQNHEALDAALKD